MSRLLFLLKVIWLKLKQIWNSLNLADMELNILSKRAAKH